MSDRAEIDLVDLIPGIDKVETAGPPNPTGWGFGLLPFRLLFRMVVSEMLWCRWLAAALPGVGGCIKSPPVGLRIHITAMVVMVVMRLAVVTALVIVG